LTKFPEHDERVLAKAKGRLRIQQQRLESPGGEVTSRSWEKKEKLGGKSRTKVMHNTDVTREEKPKPMPGKSRQNREREPDKED